MLVSLRWLARYVSLPSDLDSLADRLALSGLNHEETIEFNGDTVFDLEVTSNRGDCLGHIGVAREIATLYETELKRPDPQPNVSSTAVNDLLTVENQFPEGCPRYTARVMQGVKIGPSPDSLIADLQSAMVKRNREQELETYKPVNNVVDVTNFVLFEYGAPLHAFDYDKLEGNKIVVRRGNAGETLTAIDHREYAVDDTTCVIADSVNAQAIAGVMGGLQSEVTDATQNLVIEAATFTPLTVRRTARRLKLHSPSSFRFERRVDPEILDEASRRCAELILETGGGSLADGIIDTKPDWPPRQPIRFRLTDLQRILGIEIPQDVVERILAALGCQPPFEPLDAGASIKVTPPSYRPDLTRSADLVEEVARIHGYDKIPEDAPIPVVASARRPEDDAKQMIRSVLTAAGISEAMTPSVVTEKLSGLLSPWTKQDALKTRTQMLKGSQSLRRSLIPSLIESRATNWSKASLSADLFEIAHVYLPDPSDDGLPVETDVLAAVSGRSFRDLKGVLETLLERMGISQTITVRETTDAENAWRCSGFRLGSLIEILVDEDPVGWLGMIDPAVIKSFKLQGDITVFECSIKSLLKHSHLVPQQKLVSSFPSIKRDLNFVMEESIRWSQLDRVARLAVGNALAGIEYRETYRDPKQDGDGKKRVLMTIELQKEDATLSGNEADAMVKRLIDQAQSDLDAALLS